MFVPKSISKEDQCQGLHPITIQTYQQWIEIFFVQSPYGALTAPKTLYTEGIE